MSAKLLLRAAGVLVLAFVLTSAVMFWLPVLSRYFNSRDLGYADTYGYGGGYIDMSGRGGGYIDTYGGRLDLGYYGTAERELRALSPVDKRELVDKISAELKGKTNAELYQMRAFADPCSNGLVDCHGLKATEVKPFIDALLDARQNAAVAYYAETANWIAGGSLFISFATALAGGLTFWIRRRAKA